MAYHVPKNWKKKVKRRHSLSHPHLRKIRHALRTVLYLKFKEEQKKLLNLRSKIIRDKSTSYEERSEKHKKVNLKLNELNAMTHHYPIGCAVCADRMSDLVFRPYRGGYLCDACNNMWKNASHLKDEFDRYAEGGNPQ
jgi:hypothetical protein